MWYTICVTKKRTTSMPHTVTESIHSFFVRWLGILHQKSDAFRRHPFQRRGGVLAQRLTTFLTTL